MAWEDSLHEASFRGIAFYYRSVESEVGRRNAIFEFPKKDAPFSEDMGRRARKFRIEIILIGDNYHLQRDAIRDTLEAPGAGKFVHPFWGAMSVVVDGGARIVESTDHGGMCTIDVTFSESGEKLQSAKKEDTASTLVTQAESTSSALANAFNSAYVTAQKSASVVSDAITKVNNAATQIDKARGKIAAALNVINDVKNSINNFVGSIANIIRLPGQIATDIKSLVASVYSSVKQIQDAAQQTLNAIFGADNLDADVRAQALMLAHSELKKYGEDFKTIDGQSSVAISKRENQAALIQLVRTTSVVESCNSLAILDFSTATLAQSVRDILSSDIDTIAQDADDDLYSKLQDLKAALVAHLNSVAVTLPNLVEYVPAKTLPALVIAHTVYADAKRDGEIITANNVSNPNFILGGESIKVLQDG
jgi:prophage DNA circulation protein